VPEPDPLPPLTDKHRQFLGFVRGGMTLGGASRRTWGTTGYGQEQRWRKNKAVLAGIEEAHAAIREESKITRQDVLDGFLQAINHASLQGDANGQIKGWTEIARMHGYYEPEKKIIEHKLKVEQRHYEEMPLEQLLEMTGGDPITLAASEFEIVTIDAQENL